MSPAFWISSGVCFGIIFSYFWRNADPLSPSRVFGLIWSVSIALTELKLSAYQHVWNAESWFLLLIGIGTFLTGTFAAYVLNIKRTMVPVSAMRRMLRMEEVREERLFRIICLSVALYAISYLVIFMVKGFLPVFVVGTNISRTDFYVFGFGVLINSTAFIVFFTLLYYLMVHGKKAKKAFLVFISMIALGSYFLLLQRFQIIMAAVICFTLLYYTTQHIRLRTLLVFAVIVAAFFLWISSLRWRDVLATYLYSTAKMKFSKDFAILTEPYMYVVMNLENFARSVNRLDHHTYGYFSFDFITAISGLKYWISDYFMLDRFPYLVSGYNTYTAFWVFYRDFGVLGLAVIPSTLGFGIGSLYYRMRNKPAITNVTAYGVSVFVMVISFFVFPIALLWFEYNMLALYFILRWTMLPPKDREHATSAPAYDA